MKLNNLNQEQLDAFCRELGELQTKHSVIISPCECCGSLELQGWFGNIQCTIGTHPHHEQVLWIEPE